LLFPKPNAGCEVAKPARPTKSPTKPGARVQPRASPIGRGPNSPSPRTSPIGFGPGSPSPRASPIGFGPEGSPSPRAGLILFYFDPRARVHGRARLPLDLLARMDPRARSKKSGLCVRFLCSVLAASKSKVGNQHSRQPPASGNTRVHPGARGVRRAATTTGHHPFDLAKFYQITPLPGLRFRRLGLKGARGGQGWARGGSKDFSEKGMAGLGVQVGDGNIAHIGDFVHTPSDGLGSHTVSRIARTLTFSRLPKAEKAAYAKVFPTTHQEKNVCGACPGRDR
jgi:hypothetical protein